MCQYLILTRPEDISFVRGSFSLFKMFIFFQEYFHPLVGKGIQERPYFSQVIGTFDYELNFYNSFRKCGGARGVVVKSQTRLTMSLCTYASCHLLSLPVPYNFRHHHH